MCRSSAILLPTPGTVNRLLGSRIFLATVVYLLYLLQLLGMLPNVRRYVALAQSRGGACFCTRGAMQGYDIVLFILALAKTVTPGGGPRREPGRPAPPLKFFHFDQKILAVQKPIAYIDLLALGLILEPDTIPQTLVFLP